MQGERSVAFPIVQRVDPTNPDSPTRETGAVQVWFWCPGCDDAHAVQVGEVPGPKWSWKWSWNGSLDRPTFQPSILVRYGNQPGDNRCHSLVIDGRIQFYGDCTHALANQTVDIPPPPDWLRR